MELCLAIFLLFIFALIPTVSPSWYQISENDHAIPPDAERMFAKQINATTISLRSSHASPLSHPNEVAQLILNATRTNTK